MQIKKTLLILITMAVAACHSKQEGTGPGMSGEARPYKVIALTPESTTLYKEYPTVLQGQQTVEIRSKIAGYIDRIMVEEGDYVKAGQVLFKLNDNDIMATVRSAEAQVKVAESDVMTAKINLEKTKPLVEKEIVSQFELQSVEATLNAKEAQLAQAKANLANSRANLQYAIIKSPTDGIIGTFPYRVGSLVSSSSAQPLTTVSNTNKMYAYFSMNEKEFYSITKNLEGKNMQEKLAHMSGVSLLLPDNSLYDKVGKIETASGLVDPVTGAVNIRAAFPNENGILRSGGSGSVRIPEQFNSSIVVPQNATFELQGKHFVYVVGKDNKVKNTEIEVIAGNLKNTFVVTGGLQTGDQIVVEGIASLRDEMPIQPQLVDAKNLTQNKDSQVPNKN